MRITLPDDVADTYTTYAQRQGRPIEDVLAHQLKRFADLEPGKTAIVIQASQVPTLERRTGGMPLRSGADLVQRIEKLALVAFEGIEIELTPNQRVEIEHRAARQGRPVEDLIRECWAKLQGDLFYTMGGGEAAPAKKSA